MPIVTGPIKPFNTIGKVEAMAAMSAVLNGPLSGYLAGKERGGVNVCALEDAWCEMFGVKHAVACNSNTSGLLAAAFAVGLKAGDTFSCPAMTMSATAAAPMFTGATPWFSDVNDEDFSGGSALLTSKASFITNLFGQAAQCLAQNVIMAEAYDRYVVEDNAQSPFAMQRGRYAGTIGHIGVWSLNVHKAIQCGEGGICTTDDDELAAKMRAFINHGENAGGPIGLNLRMPEVCAAIALTQLRRGRQIVAERVEQAEEIIAAIGDIPGLRPPVVRAGCTHVYYCIPFLVEKNRTEFCAALREEGVPIEEGYVDPLYRMPAFSQFARPCPVAEDLQDRRLFYVENCAYSFTPSQIKQVGQAFQKHAKKYLR